MLIMAMVASLGACGTQGEGSNAGGSSVATESRTDNQEKPDEKGEIEPQDTKETEETKQPEAGKAEVSMEALASAAETSASAFEYCIEGDGVAITGYLGEDEIVVLPEEIDGKKVLGIHNNVFDGESGVKAVKLSNTIEYIAQSFMQNEELQYVICGETLQTIGNNAFAGCISLREVQLNEGLEKIGDVSFGKCTSLKKVYVPETVTSISSISFYMMSEDFTIQAKKGSMAEECANSNGYIFEAVE